jgi:hypothetical protein
MGRKGEGEKGRWGEREMGRKGESERMGKQKNSLINVLHTLLLYVCLQHLTLCSLRRE